MELFLIFGVMIITHIMAVNLVPQLRNIDTLFAKSIREEMGKDFIILGNINWEKQKDTHEFINGFLDFSWKKTRSGYTCKQIKDIASIIEFHDKHLSYPRLVAVNVWKIAKNPPKEKERELTKKYLVKKWILKNSIKTIG